jgi:hypothetical protein
MERAWEDHVRLALILFIAAAAVLAADSQPVSAQMESFFQKRFCTIGGSRGSSGMADCAYNTWEQCMASASGLGRYCTENPFWRETAQKPATRRKAYRQRD